MNALVKLVYGSRLYGTAIPESDEDVRSVYLSSREDCYLNRIKEAVTDSTQEDSQAFALQYFLNLACQGQSIAIEMLAAPESAWIESTPLWRELHENRRRFYTKKMHSFLCFAKNLASKYSSRIDRLTEVESILKVIGAHIPHEHFISLSEVWDELPESTNAIKGTNLRNSNKDNREYVVCGRALQATAKLDYVFRTVEAIKDSYGERVKNAKEGKIDWKALGHAFRVAHQAKEIVETGDLVYPLKNANYLRDMRLGKIDFMANALDKQLDDLIAEVQEKMDKSALPDKADVKWCDEFILRAYNHVA